MPLPYFIDRGEAHPRHTQAHRDETHGLIRSAHRAPTRTGVRSKRGGTNGRGAMSGANKPGRFLYKILYPLTLFLYISVFIFYLICTLMVYSV